MKTTDALKYERDAKEHPRIEAASLERRANMRVDAQRKITWPPATTLAAGANGDDLPSLLRAQVPDYVQRADSFVRLEQVIAEGEAERDARIGDRLDPYLMGHYREQFRPLYVEKEELREQLEAYHEVAREYIAGHLEVLIREQVKQRNAVLMKTVPFEDRIREFEHMRVQFGLITMSTRVIGVARWLAHE